MGVNLSGLVEPKNVNLEDLRGKTVAVDAYNTIYQFLSIIRQPDGTPLTDSRGRITSHLSGLLYRNVNLIEAGIEPSFVFDGKPHLLKSNTIAERRERREKAEEEWEKAKEEGNIKKAFSKAQQTSRMTDEINRSSRELLGYLGLPVTDAPSDGEAQAAYMCLKGSVWAAASQDFDSLLFGTPTLVRNITITGRRKIPGRDMYKDVRIEVIGSVEYLRELGVSREQLVDVCILMGTDFNTGVQGIGPKKGLALIKKHGKLENVLTHIGQTIDRYDEIRDIFLNGEHSDDYSVRPSVVDRESVKRLLCDEYEFSEERVESALNRIDSSRASEAARKRQRSLDMWS